MKPDICTFITARLDEEAAREAAATEGPWEARDCSDHVFTSENHAGWWWVWRKGAQHYAGVLEMDREGPEAVPTVGFAAITDMQDGVQEQKDAEFIAHTRNLAPGVIATLRAIVDHYVLTRDSVSLASDTYLRYHLMYLKAYVIPPIAAIWAGHEEYQQEWSVE